MEDSLESALSLLFIGMTTVFIVLSLVVIVGNLLITLINKFFGEVGVIENNNPSIHPKKIAAISATVEHMTGGRGRIDKIEKLK